MSIRSRRTYSLSYLFLFAAIAGLYPYLPLVLQGKGLNPSRVGFLMGGYEIVSISGLLVLGHLYDRMRSPRRTMVLLNILSMVLLFAVAKAPSVTVLIPLTLMLGFFTKSPTALLDAHFGQTHPGRSDLYGRVRLYGSLGFFLGAMLIQIFALVEGARPMSVFTAYALPLLITCILITRLPYGAIHSDTAGTEKKSFIATLREFPRIYWAGLLIVFLNYTGFSGHYTFFSLLLHNSFGQSNIGALWAIGPLFEIPLFFFSGHLLKRFGEKGLWIISILCCIVRLQVYALADSLMPLYIVQVLHSPCFSFNHIAMVSLINRHTKEENRGLAMSINSAVGMGLSLFTGGILGGFILEHGDFPLLFQLFSLFPAAGLLLLLFVGKRRPAAEKINS